MLFNRIIKQNARALKFSTMGGKIPTMVQFPWPIIDSENLRASFCEKKNEERNQEERSRILKAQFNMMKKVTKMPTSEPEEELKLLKVRLAQCGYHRALLKMPLLYYLVEGDVNKDIQFQIRNPVRIDGNILPLFTSENRLRAFYANDNNLSDNVVVHATPGSLFFSEFPKENDRVIIDFDRESSEYSGTVYREHTMSLNAQGQSLMFKKLFDRGILSGHPNVDNTIVTLVVTQVDGKFAGDVHVFGNSDVTFVSMFTSQVYSEILLHTLRTREPGKPWGVMQASWGVMRQWLQLLLSGSNLPGPGYGQCVGITLDRLPDASWTNIVGEDWVEDLLDLDIRNVSFSK
jgi:hypothetical protein